MSIRNVFPTVRPSLNLNFARSKTLDPRITFSRTSVGTYLDSDGLSYKESDLRKFMTHIGKNKYIYAGLALIMTAALIIQIF